MTRSASYISSFTRCSELNFFLDAKFVGQHSIGANYPHLRSDLIARGNARLTCSLLNVEYSRLFEVTTHGLLFNFDQFRTTLIQMAHPLFIQNLGLAPQARKTRRCYFQFPSKWPLKRRLLDFPSPQISLASLALLDLALGQTKISCPTKVE